MKVILLGAILKQLTKQIHLNKETSECRLSKIVRIENYFHQEINQGKSCLKKLNKYVTTFDYIDKILIVLRAASSGVSTISFTSVAGAPVGIASASPTLNNY